MNHGVVGTLKDTSSTLMTCSDHFIFNPNVLIDPFVRSYRTYPWRSHPHDNST